MHPRPGDVSICSTCGSINQFGEDLHLLVAPTDLLDKLDPATRTKVQRFAEKLRAEYVETSADREAN